MKFISRLFLISVFLGLSSQSLLAKLGDDEASIAKDASLLKLKQSATEDKGDYKIVTLSSEKSAEQIYEIKEYVTKGGKVFGITWSGSAEPELKLLVVDAYQDQLKAACESSPRRPGHRTKSVLNSTLVVQKWGRQRTVEGKMYDQLILPKGTGLDAAN